MTQYLHTDPADDPEGGLTLEDLRAMMLEALHSPAQDGPTAMQEIRAEIAKYSESRKRSA